MSLEYEYVEVPMAHSARGTVVYSGKNCDFVGQVFDELFFGNISIPKAITKYGKKLMSSVEIMQYLSSMEA